MTKIYYLLTFICCDLKLSIFSGSCFSLTSSVPEEKYVAKHRDFLDSTSHWLQKSGWDLNFFVSSIESLHLQWQKGWPKSRYTVIKLFFMRFEITSSALYVAQK